MSCGVHIRGILDAIFTIIASTYSVVSGRIYNLKMVSRRARHSGRSVRVINFK